MFANKSSLKQFLWRVYQKNLDHLCPLGAYIVFYKKKKYFRTEVGYISNMQFHRRSSSIALRCVLVWNWAFEGAEEGQGQRYMNEDVHFLKHFIVSFAEITSK